MPLYTTLASLSQTAASNVADGAVDAPSTIDQQTNLLASFIAQLRDGAFGTGQCRLVKSGANLVLQPYNGNRLTINGTGCIIPSAGVSLAATSLTPGTTYYIYAVASGAAVGSLEASATSHSTDTTTGVEIKTGDATRTLVGMARPITGPAWQDAANQRFVLSWFNQQGITLSAAFTTGRAYSSSVTGEVNSEIRNEFLTWANKPIESAISGGAQLPVAGVVADTWIGLDSVIGDAYTSATSPGTTIRVPVNVTLKTTATEGYHYTTLLSDNPGTAGSIVYLGAATAVGRTVLQTIIQG